MKNVNETPLTDKPTKKIMKLSAHGSFFGLSAQKSLTTANTDAKTENSLTFHYQKNLNFKIKTAMASKN